MSSEKTIIMPDNQGNTVPAWLAYGNNGWGNNGFFGNGFGSSFFGGLLGAIVPGLFNGGFGNWGGNGSGAAAASLGAQATANSNAEMIMNAINGTDADVRLLATTLNSDVDSIRLGINTIQGAIATLTAQTGMTGLQIQNAIQAGDAALASQLCECCCNMRQLVTEQGYQNQIRTIQQTDAIQGSIADLKASMIDQFCGLEKREMQSKIAAQAETISQLRGQIDNANQTAAITGYVNSLVTPLAQKVDQIASKQLPTVPVVYPNIQAVNNTPYSGNYYGGYGFGNNFVF